MNTYVLAQIERYKNKGVLVDTNISLLYIVGSLDRSLIRRHGRTSGYSEDDFERIAEFIEHFSVRITTPHILTEISNLLGNQHDLHEGLNGFIEASTEEFAPSPDIAKNAAFPILGLADAAICAAASKPYLVLTDDGPLRGFLAKVGIDSVSLEQVRTI